MTNEREPQDGAWEADDAEDNEKTTVARNPLLSPPPGASDEASVPGSQDRPSGRPSLYERLVAKGELDVDSEEDTALAALGPVDDAREDEVVTEESAVKPAASASLSQPTRGFPRPPSEFELAYMRASSTPPGEPTRPSTIPLRDSEIEMVQRDSGERVRRDSDGFISALAQDPDVDEPPVSARFRRPPELPSAPTPPQLPVPLPSVMLSPQMSTRHDSTERISTGLPNTHPLANSMAPTSMPERRREDRRSSGLLFAGVAAALVAAGVALFGGAGGEREAEQKVVVSTTKQPSQQPSVQAAPAEQIAEAKAPVPAQPVAPAEPTAEDLAREKRHRLRAEREAAAKVAASGSAAEAAQPAVEAAKPAADETASAAPKPAPAEPAATAQPAEQPKPEGGLPAQPTRDQVVAAMSSVLPGLQECVGDKHGVADVTVTVRSAGFVSYAIVGGTFVGTPEGSCIAKVVRDAKFPPFTDPFIRVTYPFNL